MAKQLIAHPVSGEIMTAARDRGAIESSQGRDIVEADYEVIVPTLVAENAGPAPAASSQTLIAGLGILSKPAQRPARRFSARGGVAFWTAGCMLIAGAFWVSGGHAIVTTNLGSAVKGTPAAITLSNVVSRVEFSGEKSTVFVDGRLNNDGAIPARLPSLEIRVAALDGSVTSYKLGTSARSLGAGEHYAFSSRLEPPKSGVRTVAVTFAE